MRQANAAPYAAFFNIKNNALLSFSPECFISAHQRQLITQPIKGTLPRSNNKALDNMYAQKLLNSGKDNAENIMIVDLMRNDLSQTATMNSVKVEKYCQLQSFKNVHHLVSTITSTISLQQDLLQAWQKCFPGGSITGAPKRRVLEIIAAVEKHSRGPYCGSIIYYSPYNDILLSNITIRSIWQMQNKLYFWAGGGITHRSTLAAEYQEMLTKIMKFIQNILI